MTVTHPEITRYFMTIPEAAGLVLQAGAIGETGPVVVLDMGEPVKIVDLARDMIRMEGRTVEEVSTTFSGLQPGDKLYEELLAHADSNLPTVHPRLRIAALHLHTEADSEVTVDLESCLVVQPPGTADGSVKQRLRRYVQEYRPGWGQVPQVVVLFIDFG